MMYDRTFSALLTLAENANDDNAQATLYDENKATIEGAMHHWLTCLRQGGAAKMVILRIAKRACYFYPYEDARAWVVSCADLECRRLRAELERNSCGHGRPSPGFDVGSEHPRF